MSVDNLMSCFPQATWSRPFPPRGRTMERSFGALAFSRRSVASDRGLRCSNARECPAARLRRGHLENIG